MSKPSYKQALIEIIMSCKNNPYSASELQNLRLSAVQHVHDQLMLSRGEPIQKMTITEMEWYNEMRWD